ncbi:Transporter [Collimonas arenae]|uniref:Transporter n=2 Tax=Collimonas arenae TaxID=279058 RepID=A0A0A1FBT4_9BURK|nr:Transporter [Collimonas arenae]
MMLEALLPLAVFAFVSSITPGPNNIMLTSSGIMFGFNRTIPHMLGVTFGFGVMLVLCAAGIGSLVLALPSIHVILKTLGSAYLLYLAWKLRNMSFKSEVESGHKPMTFFGAAVFQAANPKAWIMAITSASAFLPPLQPIWLSIGLYCLIFSVINLPCVGVWAAAGSVLRRYLAQVLWQRIFCAVMVMLTIYSAVSIWL